MSDSQIFGGIDKSAVVGAGLAAGADYITLKYAMSDATRSKRYIDSLKTCDRYISGKIKSKPDGFMKSVWKSLQGVVKDTEKCIKSGKINNKLLGKSALVGAAVFGTLYLAYRGIKGLFGKDE